MQGATSPANELVSAQLSRIVKDSSSRRSYLPARLFIHEGRAMVEPLKWGGSSDFIAFMRANALIVVLEDVHEIAEGELVEALLL